ncbi:interferon lambda-2 [Papio anubis]|uniref:interferon lambda-2 n=1 Tax=Papio anubis TaxID=9555 RepID=UPI0012AE975E|nr:interferon lambda-2 [Papio anubis]
MTGGCMPVLVLMAAVLTVTGAVPVARLRRALPDARGCHIAQFKSLSPQELQAFKRAKDALVSLPLPSCHGLASTPTPRVTMWPDTEGGVHADLDSALVDVLDQPLHTLHHILSQLRACIQPQPTAGPRPQGRLHHWLHRLQEAPKKESPGCLEASVTFNLFRLLTRDLKCVASGDLCV